MAKLIIGGEVVMHDYAENVREVLGGLVAAGVEYKLLIERQ